MSLEKKFDEYKKKLDQWESEGYDVSEFKEKWFGSKKVKRRSYRLGDVLKLIGAIAVIALVIIGLINFDLLLAVAAKLIAAIVIVGILAILVRLLFFHQR